MDSEDKKAAASPRRTVCYIVVIALFMAMILFPASGLRLTEPIDENRVPTAMPEGNMLARLWTDPGYPRSFESFFNDNYPARELLIKTKNQFDYSLFHTSDELLFGVDGNMFYKSVVASDQVALERLTDERFDALCQKMVDATELLESKDIQLYFLVCPQQNSVFPEMLPNSPIRRPAMTTYDRLMAFCAGNETLRNHTFDPKPLLREAQKTAPVFYKADFHMNTYGSAVMSKALVEQIDTQFSTGVEWCYEIVPYEVPGFQGRQLANLAIFNPPTETAYEVEGLWESTVDTDVNTWTSVNHAADRPLLPSATIVGNSYWWYMYLAGLHEHFEGVQRYTHEEFLEQGPVQDKILILQTTEHATLVLEQDLDHILAWAERQ